MNLDPISVLALARQKLRAQLAMASRSRGHSNLGSNLPWFVAPYVAASKCLPFGQPGRTKTDTEDAGLLFIVTTSTIVGLGKVGTHHWVAPVDLLRGFFVKEVAKNRSALVCRDLARAGVPHRQLPEIIFPSQRGHLARQRYLCIVPAEFFEIDVGRPKPPDGLCV